jgi:hypothetical protein
MDDLDLLIIGLVLGLVLTIWKKKKKQTRSERVNNSVALEKEEESDEFLMRAVVVAVNPFKTDVCCCRCSYYCGWRKSVLQVLMRDRKGVVVRTKTMSL